MGACGPRGPIHPGLRRDVRLPAGAIHRGRAAATLRTSWRLGAVGSITSLTGSALLALAVLRGRLSTEEAWAAAHVDEDWQREQWGRDELAEERRAFRFDDMQAAATVSGAVLIALRCRDKHPAQRRAMRCRERIRRAGMKDILENSRRGGRRPVPAAARSASPRNTRAASSPRASASISCSTRARSRSSTCSSSTAPPSSAWRRRKSRRRRRHRLGHGQRPHRLRLRQGFHRLWRLAVGDARAEDHEDSGHGDEDAAPIIGLFDAGGARIQEGVAASAATATCSSATSSRRA